MPFFPNKNIEIWEYNETQSYNDYGEPLQEYILTGTVPADFQVMSPNSTLREFGKILSDTYKIYLNTDVPVTDKAILRCEGEPATYEVIGSPQHYTHGLVHVAHTRLTVTRQRKPTKLE